ncbi:unnamed protein product, partial [Laminaria digitata]
MHACITSRGRSGNDGSTNTALERFEPGLEKEISRAGEQEISTRSQSARQRGRNKRSNNTSGGTDCLDTIGPGLEQEAEDQESRRAEGQQLCLKRKAGRKKHV